MSHLWQELKARNVLRTCTLYVAIAFGLLELVDIVSGPLNLPSWSLSAVIMVSVLGFPLAVLLSWMYVLTPDGMQRYPKTGSEVDPGKDNEPLSIEGGQFGGYTYVDGKIIFESDAPEFTPTGKIRKHVGRYYGFSSLILISLVLVLFLFYSAKSAPFQERDWVVLADFVNHTDEEIFDQSLNTAFEIIIMQSRHINVLSRRRVQEVLKRIGKETTSVIDEALSREIATREGAHVYIVPEISRVGMQYILTTKLMETESGDVLISEIFIAKSRDEVLGKLDRMSRILRRHLGESRYKISGQNKALEKATTSSLEALKQFSLGIESHIRMDFNSAANYYENAIRLDSNFTAAKASLGNIYYDRFENEKGKLWLDEAMKSLDNLTERERLGILAFYAANVEKDVDKSIEYTRMLIGLYPDYPMMRNNLAYYLQIRGDYKESIDEYKEVIRLDPFLNIPYAGLIDNYLRFLGQVDSALIWSARMIDVDPENGWGYFYRGSSYFGLGDYENAETEFEKANSLLPGTILFLYRLAHTKGILGNFDKAVEVLNEIIQLNKQASPAYYYLGVYYGMMGLEDKSRERYLQYKSFTESWEKTYPNNPTTFIAKGTVLTRLGEKEEGLKAGMKGYELDTSNHFNYARFLAVQGKTVEALYHLEILLEQGYRNIVWIKMEPDMSLLWDEPRYQQLLNQYFH